MSPSRRLDEAKATSSNGAGTPSKVLTPTARDTAAYREPPDGDGATAVATEPEDPGREPDPQGKRRKLTLPRTFDSLKERNFRFYFFSTLAQFWGLQAQQIARGYLVYDLTNSYAALGTVALLSAAPNLVFALYGGVAADRYSRKLLIQSGQATNALIAMSVAVLLFTDQLRVEHLMIAAVVQSIGMSFSMPARQAIIPDIVGPGMLMNAVPLNASGMTTMRLLAPFTAGVVIAVVGPEWLYVIMAAAFVFAVSILMPLRYRHVPPETAASAKQALRDIGGGLQYVRISPPVLLVLLLNLAMVTLAMPLMLLMPGFVADVLDAGAVRFGLLMSIMGIGTMVGSFSVATLPAKHRGKLLILGAAILGVSQLVIASSSLYWVTAVVIIFYGIGHAARLSIANVLLLSYTEEVFRGRVMSFYMMNFALAQLGVFGISLFAAVWGIQLALGIAAAMLVAVSAAAYLFSPTLRRLQ